MIIDALSIVMLMLNTVIPVAIMGLEEDQNFDV